MGEEKGVEIADSEAKKKEERPGREERVRREGRGEEN